MQSMYKLSTSRPTSEVEDESSIINTPDQSNNKDGELHVSVSQSITTIAPIPMENAVEKEMTETVSKDTNNDLTADDQVRVLTR